MTDLIVLAKALLRIANEGADFPLGPSDVEILKDAAAFTQAADALVAENKRLRELAVGYSDAVDTMNDAMKDGINVHGALAAISGYEDQIDDLRRAQAAQAEAKDD